MQKVSRQVTIRVLIFCMMLVFFGQLCFGAKQLSLTSDEPAHIANGYTILTTGDLWNVPHHGHPPLINVWNVWPLLLQQERPDVSLLPGWQDDLVVFTGNLWRSFGSLDYLAYVTRYPNMLLALLLMALVARWAREWASPLASCLALLLMAWDPTMVAHAQLNTTDLGFTLFLFLTCYLCWKLHLRFSYTTLIGIGLASGAAMSAKASGIVALPLVGSLFGAYYLLELIPHYGALSKNVRGFRTRARLALAPGAKWLSYGLGVFALSALVLWASYGFPLRPHPFAVHVDMLRIFFTGRQRLAFANGHLRTGGWWWYFPFAFAIKTPIPAILAYGLGLVQLVATPRKLIEKDLALWVFPFVYLVAALMSDVNIGFRHLLPLFPFLYVNTSQVSKHFLSGAGVLGTRSGQALLLSLGLWYSLGTVRIFPSALAYFNELVGGAENGYHYLVDSNLDWGQSFKMLKSYMDQHQVAEAWVSYSTWIEPGAYGVSYQPLFPARGTEAHFPRRYDPAPGFYAISATTLQGVELKEHDPDLYEWFRHRQPKAQPGYGLLLYEVEAHDPPAAWIAQCNSPVTPFTEEAVREGFGRSDLRRIEFDCTTSWIYPAGAQNAGWYALYHETWTHAPQFTRAQLAPFPLSYEQAYFNFVPAFALFEWRGDVPLSEPGPATPIVASPITWSPAQAEISGESYTAPVDFGKTLTFLGYQTLERPKENRIELWTTWRIREVPTRPLSLIGHLLQADAQPLVVSDGLGVLPEQWEVGDLIVQRHEFLLPQDLKPGTYWLQTGAYWLDTLERLPIQDSALESDRVLLGTIGIKR
jgi:hypothetical protein